MCEQHSLEKAKNKSMDSSQQGPGRVCVLPVERAELDVQVSSPGSACLVLPLPDDAAEHRIGILLRMLSRSWKKCLTLESCVPCAAASLGGQADTFPPVLFAAPPTFRSCHLQAARERQADKDKDYPVQRKAVYV